MNGIFRFFGQPSVENYDLIVDFFNRNCQLATYKVYFDRLGKCQIYFGKPGIKRYIR